jgi:hypothetical protein
MRCVLVRCHPARHTKSEGGEGEGTGSEEARERKGRRKKERVEEGESLEEATAFTIAHFSNKHARSLVPSRSGTALVLEQVLVPLGVALLVLVGL